MRIPKITFKNLSKTKVVIFDNEGSQVLKQTILNGIGFTIVHCRRERFHITIPLLCLMIRNILIFIKQGSLNLHGIRELGLRSCIYNVYLFSCIEYIDPKVVITFIDNSRSFHWISRMYNKCLFYAIQNGMRFDAKRLYYGEQNDVGGGPVWQLSDIMTMPNLFCFGAYEVDLYKKHGHAVDNFCPVGSLKGGFYKTSIARDNTKTDFDICLVSNGVSFFPVGDILSKYALANDYFYKWVNKYVTERRLSCCVALKSTVKYDEKRSEKDYFSNIFGNRAIIIERNGNDIFTTYAAMDRSSVVVALCSTAAFECFGWRKKTLICNLYGGDYWESPLPEICTMNVNNYEIFKTKLDCLRQIYENDYREIIQSHARYLMNYDFENPAHIVIRKMILENLNSMPVNDSWH